MRRLFVVNFLFSEGFLFIQIRGNELYIPLYNRHNNKILQSFEIMYGITEPNKA